MHPIKRFMKILKGYVKNLSWPPGCIIETYLVKEVIKFCAEFILDIESIGLPMSHHLVKTIGVAIDAGKLVNRSNI